MPSRRYIFAMKHILWSLLLIGLHVHVAVGSWSYLSFHDDSLPSVTASARCPLLRQVETGSNLSTNDVANYDDETSMGGVPSIKNETNNQKISTEETDENLVDDIQKFTICYWVKFFAIKVYNIPLMYSNYFSMSHGLNDITLYMGYLEVIFNHKATFLIWNCYCFTIDREHRVATLFVNNIFQGRKHFEKDYESFPGRTWIFLGGVDVDEDALMGDLGEIRLWFDILEGNEIEMVSKCLMLTKKPSAIISVNDCILNGNVERITTQAFDSICEYMPYSQENFIFVPQSHHDDFDMCHALGGRLPVPEDNKSNIILREAAKAFSASQGYANSRICLGIVKKKGIWLNYYTNANQSFFHWPDGTPMYGELDTELAYDWDNDYWYGILNSESCQIVCVVPLLKYTIRGLCDKSSLDNKLWAHSTHSGKMKLRSIHGTTLELNQGKKKWVIKPTLGDDHCKADLDYNMNPIPFGIKTWKLVDEKCFPRQKQHELLLTRCKSNQFSCGDFKCIPLNKVCNQCDDCSDSSDEIGCHNKTILLSQGTVADPPLAHDDQHFTIGCDVSVINYRSLNIKEIMAEVDLILAIRWKDHRVIYQHLKNNTKENVVLLEGIQPVWIPKISMISFLGAEASMTINDRSLMLQIDGKPMQDDLSIPREGAKYSSKSVTQQLIVKAFVKYTFDPILYKFPFDTQECQLSINLDGGPDAIIRKGHLDTVNPPYRSNLLEYSIVKMSLEVKNSSIPFYSNQLVLTTIFDHLFGYYILSIYMPTMLLTIICYVTLFFEREDFTNRIMVSLTSLLVLSTFLSTASASMARVSYFTMIDIWLAFCIVLVFLICLVQTGLQGLLKLSKYRDNTLKVRPLGSSKDKMQSKVYQHGALRYEWWFTVVDSFFKLFFPAAIGTFMCIYYIYAKFY